jgi:hydroxymethylpyrimidine pyrophosphatase-like HAD family hydrolase
MLQWAGIAVCPENAWQQAKQVAHAIVPSNDHDCVGVALKRFVL